MICCWFAPTMSWEVSTADSQKVLPSRRMQVHSTFVYASRHDGEPITAADVKFTFDHLISSLFGQVAIPWIEGVDMINPYEVVIHHRQRFTTGDLLALTFLPIIRPAHYWGDRDPDERTLTPPLASGPYRVTEFGSDYVVYERVENYWGRNLAINRGRNNFDEIHYDVYLDANVAREGFKKRTVRCSLRGRPPALDRVIRCARPRRGVDLKRIQVDRSGNNADGHRTQYGIRAARGCARSGSPDVDHGLRMAEPGQGLLLRSR